MSRVAGQPLNDETTADSSASASPTSSEHIAAQDWQHQQRAVSPTPSRPDGRATPSPAITPTATTDRVFPIRSVVSVDPTPTPSSVRFPGDYFHTYQQVSDARARPDRRRESTSSTASQRAPPSHPDASEHQPSAPERNDLKRQRSERKTPNTRTPAQMFSDIISSRSAESGTEASGTDLSGAEGPATNGNTRVPITVGADSSAAGGSVRSNASSKVDFNLVTHRFKHVVTKEGHAVITGRDGDALQRCEDEPIHIPGAVQGFGMLIVLKEDQDGNLVVRVVSENVKKFIGRSPRELFALESFTDILSEEQGDNLLDHIDFIKDDEADVGTNGPEVFTLSIKVPGERARKFWCGIHMNEANPGWIICEFELEDDRVFPLRAAEEDLHEQPEDTLNTQPTEAEFIESTESLSKPLRILRSARRRRGEAAAMEVFNIMSQVQEQLASAPNLEKLLKVLVGVVRELTGFHRVMIYQFDQAFNGRVVTELVDPKATKDLYHGLKFPASDIPRQARELYKLNRVRVLYDRDLETARLVCRTPDDIQTPLDMTHCYLRAMSPIHVKYLHNMAVRASMSISINAFNELWGLISCHSYGSRGMRVSFPIRKMCRLVGDAASRNIERLSYASRLQARKLINTAPTQASPSGYIIASSDDLLKLFDADFGLLSIHDETKILGRLEHASQEALAMLEYLRMRRITSVMTSQDITQDFPDLRYPPGFQLIAGMLIVPLSTGGRDFIVFFRKGELKEVKWAGNPYEKFIREGTEGYLEPRTSFKIWRETVVGKCREWTEDEVETAAVLCLIYGKFIDVWRQKEAALQSSQLTRLLLANSAHEVRTPLNAIINYLEIALEGSLDQEIRDNLTKSHSASKSLIYVINDLLDLTKAEEGGSLIKGESFDLSSTLKEAAHMFVGDAKRKGLAYEVIEHPGLPKSCIGDQRRVRQAISNIIANAIQHTTEGGIKVEMYVASWTSPDHVNVEVAVADTGVGMDTKKLDQLFNELEQAQTETSLMFEDSSSESHSVKGGEKGALGLGLAVVSRIIRNMNGQLRLKSEEGKGSRFVISFPFDLPDSESSLAPPEASEEGSTTPTPETPQGERTLVAPSSERRSSASSQRAASKRGSVDSMGSLNAPVSKASNSVRSFKSGSTHTQRSDVDRLIEAIQGPPSQSDQESSEVTRRPILAKRNSVNTDCSSPPPLTRSKSHDVQPAHRRSTDKSVPGEERLAYSSTPLRPVKIPEDAPSAKSPPPPPGVVLGEIDEETAKQTPAVEMFSADQMRVLVAEDDPVNSRIIKKRLEKLGHTVILTSNGEECAAAFCDHPRDFDVVLMDMQMPIVDGLTSTKLIRSFEKTHPNNLSPRAARCGRIPIIAVSASLVERSRQEYIDGGFDAWILKPIPFDRLSVLMTAIVDKDVRCDCLYQPGHWEQGGWFHCEKVSVDEADTKPSGEHPQEAHTQLTNVDQQPPQEELKEKSQEEPQEETKEEPKEKEEPKDDQA
ncbi:hypothetical protein M011DRAFT_406900 [Sporormia fimetaria CBS 119925]|uniref:Phytochrome-like histidine kinase PHY1p n=1 Tax=Sporormia fimetaria CBS 119925 TaxID=1340428 RepID=A0A6A6V5G1_9PLEO|nr:hypothetical protein M011DRAFT_406900 [Sporormia fimetaria CBS 119925]